jgi:hypothetical protein
MLDRWVRLASAGVLFAILLIILYVVPLIRWRGAMFYDRRLGLIVTGPQKRKKAPPPLAYDGR